jgi:uncharacterized membrane protein
MGASDSNQVVGNAFNASGTTNYLFDQINYRRLSIPNAPGATVTGINPAGTAVVGYYSPTGGMAGFIYQNGHLRTLKFPGSASTLATGINSVGEVVGFSTTLTASITDSPGCPNLCTAAFGRVKRSTARSS